MTGSRDTEHLRFEELAAGYALDALEPDDERRFHIHAVGCAGCRELVNEFRAAAAALAEALPEDPAPSRLGARIRAAAGDAPSVSARAAAVAQPVTTPRPGRSVDSPARRRSPWLVAAAAVLAVAGGVWAGLALTGRSSGGEPTAACLASAGCRQVALTSPTSHHLTGYVDLRGDTAWLLPSGLRADDARTQIYVLWQVTGRHVPLAVASFDVTGNRHALIRVGQVPAPLSDTVSFAVSLETGRTIPAHPSQPVAVGTLEA